MNKNKHIVFCSTSYAEYDRRIQRIIAALLEEGYSCSWISRSYNNSFQYIDTEHKFIETSISGGFLFYAIFNIKLFLYLRKMDASAFCAIDLDTILPVYFAGQWKSQPVIFDAHEYFTEVPELKNRSFVRWFWERIGNYVCPKIKRSYTVGEELRKIFTQKYNVQYQLVRNIDQPAPTTPFQPSDNRTTMVYLGALNIGRGLEIAIESLRTLTDVELLILGDGDITSELKQLVVDCEVSDRVIFKGYVPPKEVISMLRTCWIGLNMLDNESQSYYYSLANKYFDYIHAGLPSISMNFPEYRNINDEFGCGVLVDEYSLNSFVEAVNELQNAQLYSNCLDGCELAAQKYNWDREKRQLVSLYHNWI